MKDFKLIKTVLFPVILGFSLTAQANETIKNVIITSVGFDYEQTNCSIKYNVGGNTNQLAQWDCAVRHSDMRDTDSSEDNFRSLVTLAYTTQSSVDIVISRASHINKTGAKSDSLIAITVEKK